MKDSRLELLFFLAVRWCSLPMPLSLIEGNMVTAYYYGAAMPFTIIPWYNSKTSSNLQPLVINAGGAVMFTAIIRKTISCFNWILDNLKRSNLEDSITSLATSGSKNLCRNGIGILFERNSFSSNI